jgi:hypothetical protein
MSHPRRRPRPTAARSVANSRFQVAGGGRAGGFFGLAEPVLVHAAQRSLRTDLATRKRLLEGQRQT